MDWCGWKSIILVVIALWLGGCHKGEGSADEAGSDVTTKGSPKAQPNHPSATTGASETGSTPTSPTVTNTKGNQIPGVGSAGCGKDTNTGFTANNTLDVSGTSRTYDIFVPPTYNATQ